jgi:hypothetical protein
VTIIDLTSVDSEDKFERFTCDGLYRLSPLPEMFKIVRGEYDGEQIPKQMLYMIYITKDTNLLASALPDSLEAFIIKASEDKSIS